MEGVKEEGEEMGWEKGMGRGREEDDTPHEELECNLYPIFLVTENKKCQRMRVMK